MPAGAPEKYKPEYADTLLELMKEGASMEEICLELDICKQTLYTWFKKHPELLDAKKKGKTFSEGWWKREGRVNLQNKDFNSTLWYMNMKNRFGWSDKTETDITSKGKQVNIPVIGWAEPNAEDKSSPEV